MVAAPVFLCLKNFDTSLRGGMWEKYAPAALYFRKQVLNYINLFV